MQVLLASLVSRLRGHGRVADPVRCFLACGRISLGEARVDMLVLTMALQAHVSPPTLESGTGAAWKCYTVEVACSTGLASLHGPWFFIPQPRH